jgi:hypothetical protein
MLLVIAASVAHQAALQSWYIEDAAISFSYARNWANGDGLVTYPGGERVEGYSNPTWVALLALGELAGFTGFESSKFLGWLFGAATVPFVFLAARGLRPGRNDATPWIAAAFFAANPQVAIWNTSGLENSLFNLLMAAGVWRIGVEVQRGRWPVSALLFFLLAITRPEAMLYAAIAGFWAMVFAWQDGRGLRPTLGWLGTFFVPWGAYQAAHLAYFAWPLPNTYYAKTDAGDFSPWNWGGRGWKYVRNYAHDTGQGYFAPVYLAALIGDRERRRWWWIGVSVLAVALLYPGTDAMVAAGWPTLPAPPWWSKFRVASLLILGLILPRLLIGRPGWRTVVLAWDLFFAGAFFALWSGGDWMRGFRWFAMVSVPMALLFAAGVARIADDAQWIFGRAARERWTRPAAVAVAALLVAVAVPSLAHTQWVAKKPDTSPYSVKKRVDYMNGIRDRIHLDGPIRTLDVDMGANMWWSGHEINDIAGLVDVSMAHHNYEKAFVREYVFTERKPQFAHVHGGWANTSKIPTHPEWKRDYLALPPYPTSKTATHEGNHLRKALLFPEAWVAPPDRSATFAGGFSIVGIAIPGEIAGRGRALFLEVGMRRGTAEDVRVVAFLSDGERLHSFDLPPAYDWHPTSKWAETDTFVGRYAVKLPETLTPGRYDLGFAVFGADGQPRPAETAIEPHFAAGEVRFPAAVEIVDAATLAARTKRDLEEFSQRSDAADCIAAEAAWNTLRWRYPRDSAWKQRHEPAAAQRLARCWTAAALRDTDRARRRDSLLRARAWDFRESTTVRAAGDLAEVYYQEGLTARAQRDSEDAYRRFSDAVALDPSLAWARRYAEEARDQRLKIGGPKAPKAPATRVEKRKGDPS